MSGNITWLVRRLHWRHLLTASVGARYVRLPGAATVAEFDDREDAEADRWAREVAVRGRVNPFRCGFDLADVTHIPDFAFKDFLMDDSLRPARFDSTAQIRWDKWWDKHSSAWNADRKARIWEALDKVRFFEVVGREADRQIFVAVEAVSNTVTDPVWERWRYPTLGYGTEGGRPVRAFHSRADAEAHLELFTEATDDPSRIQIDIDPFTHPDAPARVPADRVHDVPLDGEWSADLRTVFVLCRVGFRVQSSQFPRLSNWEFDHYPTGEVRWADDDHPDFDVSPTRYAVRLPRLVPEAAFTTREVAEECAQERMRSARRWLNPHLIYEFARTPQDHSDRSARWWSANVSNAPDAEFEAAWAGFAHLSLYHVVGVEFDG